jgi:hypothetical protein
MNSSSRSHRPLVHSLRRSILASLGIFFCCGTALVFTLAEAHAARPAGDVLELRPDEPLVTVEKVMVSDSRAVRGFLGTPVDGSIVSWGYRGAITEYPDTGFEGYDAGTAVDYAFNGNDGLHLTFADSRGFDLVVLRGGAKTKMYTDNRELVEPRDRTPAHVFRGSGGTQNVLFPSRVAARGVSLFDVHDGAVADVAFYRISRRRDAGAPPRRSFLTPSPLRLPEPVSRFDAASIVQALPERYPDSSRPVYAISETAPGNVRIPFRASVPAHFVTTPTGSRSGLDAVAFDVVVSDAPGVFTMTVVVQDPLNPRLDLAWVEFLCAGNGRYRVRLDVPDQVLFEDSRLWLTLMFDRDLTLSGPDGSAPVVAVEAIPVAQALPSAVAHRKFLLKSFFAILSETRRWGAYNRERHSRDEYYASLDERRRHGYLLSELFMTLDVCHELAPEDDMIRQYREWVFLNNLDHLSEVAPPPEPPPGVPAWAWYPRLGWLEVRRIAEWWLDNRLVPTGEFGGMLGDDTDLYQQFTDLPSFENDGVGARLKDAAARLAELGDQRHLRGGINLLETDALHAYEEGMNHLALMARWFYGDPIYYERCLESAASMAKLTVKTADGRRHIPHGDSIGYRHIEDPRPPTVDGGSTPLLWHPTLQAIEYNRNPGALELVREWGDTWLRYQEPGRWATAIDVQSGRVLEFDRGSPLSGRAQAHSFTWLYRLTRDSKYIEPFLHVYRQGEAPSPSNGFLHDLYNLGALDELPPATLEQLASHNPTMDILLTRDPSRMIGELIGASEPPRRTISTLYETQRWPDIYTKSELYTDRIFVPIMQHPSTAYLGGYSYRNRYVPANAISWEGLGLDYGALVTVNRPDHLEVLTYNLSEKPLSGTMRIWGLRHGRYRIETGFDRDGDNELDSPATSVERVLARADGVPVTITPNVVNVIRITQLQELDDITARADLALAAREIKLKDGVVSGVVHNIGSRTAEQTVVAVFDGEGKRRVQIELGALAAPNDMKPKRVAFSLRLPGNPDRRWTLKVDPDNAVPEIYEGNNAVSFEDLASFNESGDS